jgi:replicative DNA helicase
MFGRIKKLLYFPVATYFRFFADVCESGAIEQDVDVVKFLYRPDTEASGTHIPNKLLIAKHRNGPTGEMDLMFQGNRIRLNSVG